MPASHLPLPDFYTPSALRSAWRVPYEERAAQARQWADQHALSPAAQDDVRIGLLLIDVQNTFCLADYELFVAGRSGDGAVTDNQRLAGFIYANLGRITGIMATMDTHKATQIFHALFLVDADGKHPAPYTQVSAEDIATRRWRFNPALAPSLGLPAADIDAHLRYYTARLAQAGKYALTIWPYHAMLGGIGHALVSGIEEALFFHSIARNAQPLFIQKGDHPLTEAYSAIGPEVLNTVQGAVIGTKDQRILNSLENLDALIIAGQAKSHCVAWTVEDLLAGIQTRDPGLARKVYLLEDCTSPVVIPGVVDYTDQADAAYARFAEAGMQRVNSTTPMQDWPDFPAA